MAKLKVLLVDDEADFLEIMGLRITEWGYEVAKAVDGAKALEAIKVTKPDIVVLDYMLPDMDGIKVLEEVRKTDKKVPVIMFTAYPDKKSMEGTEKLGISAFIPKFSVYSDVLVSLKSAIEMVERQPNK